MTKKAMRNKINKLGQAKYRVKSYKAKKFWMYAGTLALTASGVLAAHSGTPVHAANITSHPDTNGNATQIGNASTQQSHINAVKNSSGQYQNTNPSQSHLNNIQHQSNNLVTALMAKSRNQSNNTQNQLTSQDNNQAQKPLVSRDVNNSNNNPQNSVQSSQSTQVNNNVQNQVQSVQPQSNQNNQSNNTIQSHPQSVQINNSQSNTNSQNQSQTNSTNNHKVPSIPKYSKSVTHPISENQLNSNQYSHVQLSSQNNNSNQSKQGNTNTNTINSNHGTVSSNTTLSRSKYAPAHINVTNTHNNKPQIPSGVNTTISGHDLSVSGDFSNYHGGALTGTQNGVPNQALSNISDLHLGSAKDLTDTHDMFRDLPNLRNIYADNDFDTSKVTNMSNMFADDIALHNLNGISNFDTSRVYDMSNMFGNDSNLSDATGIKNWNTTNVTNMDNMFLNDNNLQKIAIGNNGLKFSSSKYGKPFVDGNGNALGYWNSDNSSDVDINNASKPGLYVNQTSVVNAADNISPFTGLSEQQSGTWGTAHWTLDNDGNFTVSNGTISDNDDSGDGNPLHSDVTGGSYNTNSNTGHNPNINTITLNNVSINGDANDMFGGLSNLTSFNGNNPNTSEVFDMPSFFASDYKLNTISGMSDIDTSNVGSLNSAFADDHDLSDISFLSNWNVHKVNMMDGLFSGDHKLSNISPLSNWHAPNISLLNFFLNGTAVSDLSPLSHWNVSNVSMMNAAFSSDSNLTSLKGLSDWDTKNVSDIDSVFSNDANLTGISALSNWNTSNFKSMNFSFANDKSLADLSPLKNWNTDNVTVLNSIFSSDSSLPSDQFNNLLGWRFNSNNVTNTTAFSFGIFNHTNLNAGQEPIFYQASDGKYAMKSSVSKVKFTYYNWLTGKRLDKNGSLLPISNTVTVSDGSKLVDDNDNNSSDAAHKLVRYDSKDTGEANPISMGFSAPQGWQFPVRSDSDLNINTFIKDALHGNDVINSDSTIALPLIPSDDNFSSDQHYGYYNIKGGKTPAGTAKYEIDKNGNMIIANGNLLGAPSNNSSDLNYFHSAKHLYLMSDATFSSDADHLFSNLPIQSFNVISSGNKLNSSGLIFANISSAVGMFYNDPNLSNISGLSAFDFSINLTDLSNMFQNDSSLKNISPLLFWDSDVANVFDMSNMFDGDTSLSDVSPLSGWKMNNIGSSLNNSSGINDMFSHDYHLNLSDYKKCAESWQFSQPLNRMNSPVAYTNLQNSAINTPFAMPKNANNPDLYNGIFTYSFEHSNDKYMLVPSSDKESIKVTYKNNDNKVVSSGIINDLGETQCISDVTKNHNTLVPKGYTLNSGQENQYKNVYPSVGPLNSDSYPINTNSANSIGISDQVAPQPITLIVTGNPITSHLNAELKTDTGLDEQVAVTVSGHVGSDIAINPNTVSGVPQHFLFDANQSSHLDKNGNMIATASMNGNSPQVSWKNGEPVLYYISDAASVPVHYVNSNDSDVGTSTLHGYGGNSLDISNGKNLSIPNNYEYDSSQNNPQSVKFSRGNSNSPVIIHVKGKPTDVVIEFVTSNNNPIDHRFLSNQQFGNTLDLSNLQAPSNYNISSTANLHPQITKMNPTFNIPVQGATVGYDTAKVNIKDSLGHTGTTNVNLPSNNQYGNSFTINPSSVSYKPGFTFDPSQSVNLINGNIAGTYGASGVMWKNNSTPTLFFNANPENYYINYKNQNGDVVGHDTLDNYKADMNVSIPTNGNQHLNIPAGYNFDTNRNPSSLNIGLGNSEQHPETLYVSGNLHSSPITVNYVDDGSNVPNPVTVLTKHLSGQVGNSVDLSGDTPKGYTINSGQATKYVYGTVPKTVNLGVSGVPIDPDVDIKGYGPDNYTHDFPISFTGNVGDEVSYDPNTLSMPDGYTLDPSIGQNLSNGTIKGKINANDGIDWPNVTAPTLKLDAKPESAPVEYINQNSDNVGSGTLNGHVGETENLTPGILSIPNNYTEDQNQPTSYKFNADENNPLVIHVSGKPTSAKVNFIDNNTPKGNTVIPNVNVGDSLDLSNVTLPTGYQLTGNNNLNPQISSQNPTYNLNITGSTVNYDTTLVNTMDSSGNTGTVEISLPENNQYNNSFTVDPHSISYRPGYSLNLNDSKNLSNGYISGKFGLNSPVWSNNARPTLYYQADPQNYYVQYVNQNHDVVGHDYLNKPTNTIVSIPTENNAETLHIPNGYVFDSAKNEPTINIGTGNSENNPDTIYVQGKTSTSPITVHYINNDSELTNPITVSTLHLNGQIGSPIDLSSFAPHGYSVVPGQTHVYKYSTNPQTVNLNMNGDPVTESVNVKGIGPDGYTHEFPLSFSGRVGDEISKNPNTINLPKGYSLDPSVGDDLDNGMIKGRLGVNGIDWSSNYIPSLRLDSQPEHVDINYINQNGNNVGFSTLNGGTGDIFNLTGNHNLQIPRGYSEDSNQQSSVTLNSGDNNPINIHVHGNDTTANVNFLDPNGHILGSTTVPNVQIGNSVDLSNLSLPSNYQLANGNNLNPTVNGYAPNYDLTLQGAPVGYNTAVINTEDSNGHTGTATINIPAGNYGHQFSVNPSTVTYAHGYGLNTSKSTNLTNGYISGTYGANNPQWPDNNVPTLYYDANAQTYYINYVNQNNAVVGHDSLSKPSNTNVNITNGTNLSIPDGYTFDNSKNVSNINVGTGNDSAHPKVIYVDGNTDSSPITVNYIDNSSELNSPRTVSTRHLTGTVGNSVNLANLIPDGYTLSSHNPNVKYSINPQTYDLYVTGNPVTNTVNVVGSGPDGYTHEFPITVSGHVGDPAKIDPTQLSMPSGYSLDSSLGNNLENNSILGYLGPHHIMWPGNNTPTLNLDAHGKNIPVNYLNQSDIPVGYSTLQGHVGDSFDLNSPGVLSIPNNYVEDPGQVNSATINVGNNNPITIHVHGKETNGTVDFVDEAGHQYGSTTLPDLQFGSSADLTNVAAPENYVLSSSNDLHPMVSKLTPTYKLLVSGMPLNYNSITVNTKDNYGHTGSVQVPVSNAKYGDNFNLDPASVTYKSGYAFNPDLSSRLSGNQISGTFGRDGAEWSNNEVPTLYYNALSQNYYVTYKNQNDNIVGHQHITALTDDTFDIPTRRGNNTLDIPNGYTFDSNRNGSALNIGTGNTNDTSQVIYVDGKADSGPVTVSFVNNSSKLANPVNVSSRHLTGTIGDTVNFSNLVPRGYSLAPHQPTNITYTTNPQDVTLNVIGDDVSHTINVKGTGPNDYTHEFPIQLSGQVGDPFSINPTQLSMPSGYSLDSSLGNNLQNGLITGSISPSGANWPGNDTPELTLDPEEKTIPVNYINQNGNVIAHGDISGHVNDNINLNASGVLNIPDGYDENGNQPTTLHVLPGNNNPLNIKVHGIPAGDIDVTYVNQDGDTVSRHNYDSGTVGNRVSLGDNIPDGYSENSGQPSSLVYDTNEHRSVIHITGNLASFNEYVTGAEQDGHHIHFPITLSGRIGDTVTYDPDTLNLPNGYNLNLNDSNNLDGNNQISAKLNPNDVSWSVNNKRPVLSLVPQTRTIPVTYVNSTTKANVGNDNISGLVDGNTSIVNCHGLHLPKGYHDDIVHNPTSIHFKADDNNPITLYVLGNSTNANITYLNQNGQLVGSTSLPGVVGSHRNLYDGSLPDGYHTGVNSNMNPLLGTNNHYTVHLIGDLRTYPRTVRLIGSNGLDTTARVIMHNRVGNIANVNPNTIKLPSGYKLNLGASSNLRNGLISAIINNSNSTWYNHNNQPELYCTAKGESIPVSYVNQNNVKVGADTLNGSTNGNFAINSRNLHVPAGYHLNTLGNPMFVRFHTHNSPLTLHVTGNPAGKLTVQYINQNGKNVNTKVYTGLVGNTAHYHLYVPNGYTLDNGGQTSTVFTPQSHTKQVHVLGNLETYHTYVDAKRDYLPDKLVPVTLHNRIGNYSVISPRNLPSYAGYRYDAPTSRYLDKSNDIRALITPNSFVWAKNNIPQIHYKANPKSVRVHFINQNDTKLTGLGQTVNGYVNETKSLHGIKLPNGYHFDIDHAHNPRNYKFGTLEPQNINVYVTGNLAQPINVQYINQTGHLVANKSYRGLFGNNSSLNYIPNGYHINRGQNLSVPNQLTPQHIKLYVTGNLVKPMVNVHRNLTIPGFGKSVSPSVNRQYNTRIGDSIVLNPSNFAQEGTKPVDNTPITLHVLTNGKFNRNSVVFNYQSLNSRDSNDVKPIKVIYLNQHRNLVVSHLVNGYFGETQSSDQLGRSTVPEGYNMVSGQDHHYQFTDALQPPVYVDVSGNRINYNSHVNITKDGHLAGTRLVHLSGNIGDNVTVNPDSISVPGYHLDPSQSRYLNTDNDMTASLGTHDFHWLNNATPVLHYVANHDNPNNAQYQFRVVTHKVNHTGHVIPNSSHVFHVPVNGFTGQTFTVNPDDYAPHGYHNANNASITGSITPNGLSKNTGEFNYAANPGARIIVDYDDGPTHVGSQKLHGDYNQHVNNKQLHAPLGFKILTIPNITFTDTPQTVHLNVKQIYKPKSKAKPVSTTASESLAPSNISWFVSAAHPVQHSQNIIGRDDISASSASTPTQSAEPSLQASESESASTSSVVPHYHYQASSSTKPYAPHYHHQVSSSVNHVQPIVSKPDSVSSSNPVSSQPSSQSPQQYVSEAPTSAHNSNPDIISHDDDDANYSNASTNLEASTPDIPRMVKNKIDNDLASHQAKLIPSPYHYLVPKHQLSVYPAVNFKYHKPILHLPFKVLHSIHILHAYHVVIGDQVYTRYEIDENGYVGFVTGNPHYVANAYYTDNDAPTHYVQVILSKRCHGIYSHSNLRFTKHNRVHYYPSGTVLHVTGIHEVGNTSVYRYQLSNGTYITANKLFVKIV